MSVSIITFANLGKKENLRTAEIAPMIDAFADAGELRQIICEINAGFYFKRTYPAIPTLLRYAMRAFEKTTGKGISRPTREKLFDLCASLKLARADVTIFHGGQVLPKTAAKAASKGSITADITTYATYATNAALEKEEFSRLGYASYEGWYTALAKNAEHVSFDYLIATSEFAKRSYVESGFPADRIFLAYPDVDLTRFVPKPAPSDGVSRLLYLAFTTPLKGLHYLLDAWEQLNLPNAELTIVGGFAAMPASLQKTYEDRIRSNPSIKYVPGTDKPETYFAQASALVFPTLTEGFGKVTLEAMASGLPVITTENAPGIVKDGESGFVVPIRDVDVLKEKIRFLYDHPETRREMGVAARKAAENKQSFGQGAFDAYREIMRREKKL